MLINVAKSNTGRPEHENRTLFLSGAARLLQSPGTPYNVYGNAQLVLAEVEVSSSGRLMHDNSVSFYSWGVIEHSFHSCIYFCCFQTVIVCTLFSLRCESATHIPSLQTFTRRLARR